MDTIAIPSFADLLEPTLAAVIALGGSGTIDEITSAVLERGDFSEAQQAHLHGDGPRTELEYRLAWARTYLKGMKALENSARGVWAATDAGRKMDSAAVRAGLTEYRAQLRAARQARESEGLDTEEAGDARESEDAQDWKEQLLEHLLAIEPAAFERLAQRLLREAGFISANVTGRSGDGGIDGLGVYRLSLVSFPVFFQCKRYRGSVGAASVRDFRGAMAGRGDKGLLITTGSFTSEAKGEATRDGAPPIDLIDGDRLCELLKEYGLGVQVSTRTIEDVCIDPHFLSDI